jgi:predicted dehydrogenase
MSYKAGIIGAGGIAGLGIFGLHDEETIGQEKIRASHAGGYEATADIDLVAVADVDEETLRTFGEVWNIPEGRRYEGHKAMLEAESLDVVSVCTPSYLHHEHVVDAASIGDPDVIWCEKPIASQVSNAMAMVDVCDQTGTELVINHSFRFTDKLRQLEELVNEEGIIGEVRSVSTQFRMELLRNATHLLDTLVYLLDARAERVQGHITGDNEVIDGVEADTSDVDDAGGGGYVVMDDGTFVTIDCTIPRDISSMNFSIIGTDGKLYLNNDDGEWRYWALQDGEHLERPLPGIDGAWTWDDDYRTAFANAAEHVAALLEGRAENHSTGQDAIRSLEIIVGFYVSHYTGGTATIPLERPLRDVRISSW